ncbi:MAG: DUF368 domain-containing protein [Phocaeicola sp.]|nr:DUF368 domain-containing protein [Phocaeicola sp.]MDD7448025.1 DUF368 domain-containing protein [Prevotellaceae bacterium]MDY3914766.1 DUF368 domain-containing protein [Phocaeicola sp.]MDY5938794.1 DUF368 domain-containing protein [Phocaeicola sp.]
MARSIKDYFVLVAKGMGMGAADVVPGVSGGTIAFIVGIYDELLNTIKSINIKNLRLLLKGDLKAFFTATNAYFLIAILAGIAISILSLAKLITYLLDAHPVLVWSFFFGLVLASAWFVSKEITRWNFSNIILFIAGTILAFYITMATPAETSSHPLFIFVCGAVAICAMILPGISGSFILVLMGKYYYIMEAIKNIDITTILIFGAGAFVGITSFSRILSYALSHIRNATLAILSGFMLGSLNKVWPWKAQETILSEGHKIRIETNILPEGDWYVALLLMCTGFILVYFIEKFGNQHSQKNA